MYHQQARSPTSPKSCSDWAFCVDCDFLQQQPLTDQGVQCNMTVFEKLKTYICDFFTAHVYPSESLTISLANAGTVDEIRTCYFHNHELKQTVQQQKLNWIDHVFANVPLVKPRVEPSSVVSLHLLLNTLQHLLMRRERAGYQDRPLKIVYVCSELEYRSSSIVNRELHHLLAGSSYNISVIGVVPHISSSQQHVMLSPLGRDCQALGLTYLSCSTDKQKFSASISQPLYQDFQQIGSIYVYLFDTTALLELTTDQLRNLFSALADSIVSIPEYVHSELEQLQSVFKKCSVFKQIIQQQHNVRCFSEAVSHSLDSGNNHREDILLTIARTIRKQDQRRHVLIFCNYEVYHSELGITWCSHMRDLEQLRKF